jgi:hypothetical protein
MANMRIPFLFIVACFLLLPAKVMRAVEPASAAITALAPEKLSRGELSDEVYAFKQEVYRRHVARGEQLGRTRVFDLPKDELDLIPGTKILMRKDAAQALGGLLDDARADLARDLMAPKGDKETEARRARALRVKELGINNAYRPASQQFAIWDRNFMKYYDATAKDRAACEGGPHGSAAADLLREYIGIRVAAPGFSNHQGGIAVDFALLLKPGGAETQLGPSTAQSDGWKESWFWQWLKKRAGEFGFVEYQPEEWHWEYKPEQVWGK